MPPKTGRGASFEDAYVELFVRAERVARRIVPNAVEAEDVAAETMVRALSSWTIVRTYSMPWVTRVATNLAFDIVRRRSPVICQSAISFENDSVNRSDLIVELRRLPYRQRQAVVLRYMVGFDEAETGIVMGVSAGTGQDPSAPRPWTLETSTQSGTQGDQHCPSLLRLVPKSATGHWAASWGSAARRQDGAGVDSRWPQRSW